MLGKPAVSVLSLFLHADHRPEVHRNIGINTTAPAYQLDINAANGNCLSLIYNDADGTPTNDVDFQVTSGGKLTINNSACDQLKIEDVSLAEDSFSRFRAHGIALAVPEVPLAARRKLLELGTQHHFFCVAAFNSAEISPAFEMELFTLLDLLSLNLDEAACVAGFRLDNEPALSVVEAALSRLRAINPALQVTITAGKDGSWSWDGTSLGFLPAFQSRMVRTAGGGDAFLAGVIAGLVAQGPLQENYPSNMLAANATLAVGVINGKGFEERGTKAFEGQARDWSGGLGPLSYDYYQGYNGQTGQPDPNLLSGHDIGYSWGSPLSGGAISIYAHPIIQFVEPAIP